MSKIKSTNTRPEMLLRRWLFKRGARYRIHYKIAGSPDIVFPSKKIAVFMHGCFWHGHGCRVDHTPRTNTKYWKAKIIANTRRDARKARELRKNDWSVITIWECQLENIDSSARRILTKLQAHAIK